MSVARIACALGLVALGCSKSASETPSPEPASKPPPKEPPSKTKAKPVTATSETDGLELTWTLTAEPDKLAIDYQVENTGGAKVWIADQLLQNTPGGRVMKVADRLIVRNGDSPETASFVLGMTYESMTTGRERPAPSPSMKPLEPGQKLSGRAEVPLPLEAWHNYGRVDPLTGDKRQAVLELTYIDDPDQERAWWKVPLEDGREVPAPNPMVLKKIAKRITSKPLSLP